MKEANKGPELLSLNDELYSMFSVQELEQRLETDPLVIVTGISSLDGGCKLCSPFNGDGPCDLQVCNPFCPGVCVELMSL